jgi:hypothetical protein
MFPGASLKPVLARVKTDVPRDFCVSLSGPDSSFVRGPPGSCASDAIRMEGRVG